MPNRTPTDPTRVRLFCVPFAGGSGYSYRPLLDFFSERLEIVLLELPGRGTRFSETLLTDLDAMTEDLEHQIRPALDAPYAIFGHSLGAWLAYLVARRLVAGDAPAPIHLFLSGRGGMSAQHTKTHHLPADDFWRSLAANGNDWQGLLQNRELMEIFEPILRADMQAADNFQYLESVPIDVPLTVMFGDKDTIGRENFLTWHKETTKSISFVNYPGGHFFLFDHLSLVCNRINHTLEKVLPDCFNPVGPNWR